MSLEEQLKAIGQEHVIGAVDATQLQVIDEFYQEIGGISGYQKQILDLIAGSNKEEAKYHVPNFIDITQEKEIDFAFLEEMAEIYVLGGAADRLHLVDEKSGEELPAAKLPFAGKMLLEHLIRDLEAREYLYYKRTGKKIVTPIAMMTSEEKKNHTHVMAICEANNWFGRPKESIRIFTQPLVPSVDATGKWCVVGGKLLLKPGGHGALWKLAKRAGIFEWLRGKKVLIRQINNPLAGLDAGLLAFCETGCRLGKTFGFASTKRLPKSAEGVNVLVEKKGTFTLTNIEYCDLEKHGVSEEAFTANTNILFADLDKLSSVVEKNPFPGMLINLKKTQVGGTSLVMGRLESTMQNIADVLPASETYVTYNHRHKTISSAKKAYVPGGALQDTPENCFYELLLSHRELLLSCGFTLPEQRAIETYLKEGPEFCFLYHPALGPLYSIIREKLQKGALQTGSELIVELADFSAKNLHVSGSLRILADEPLEGRCILENVTIENEGVNWTQSEPFWKMNLDRKESVTIRLKGKSTFIAKNIRLKGNYSFVVESGETKRIE